MALGTLEPTRISCQAHNSREQYPTDKCNKSVCILVVSNNFLERRTIVDYLQAYNTRRVLAAGSKQMARLLTANKPGLVILDWLSHSDSAANLLRAIRAPFNVNVIITGSRREESDRANLLELGAGDYLLKLFSLRELLARRQAILRRRKIDRTEPTAHRELAHRRFNGWQVDLRTRRVTAPNGTPVILTKREYALLVAFLAEPQQPLSREHLLCATRVNTDAFDRSIDIQVMRLRRKLAIGQTTQEIIRTERGIGYVFFPTVESF